MLDLNKIYFEDFFNGVNFIDNESIDLIICDGPYNSTIHSWDKVSNIQEYNLNLIKIFAQKLKNGGSCYIFGKFNAFDFIDYRPFLKLNSKIIWYQPSRLSQGRKNFTNNYDLIGYFSKGIAKTFNLNDIRIPQIVELEHRKRCENVPSVKNGKWNKTKFNDKGKNPGNCFSSDTKVFTKNGWKYFYELNYEDEILTFNKNFILEYQKPFNIIEENYSGQMYELKHKSCNLCMTPNHNLFVCKKHNNNYDFIEIQNMNKQMYSLPQKIHYYGKRKDFFILENKKYQMDLFLKFLGVYLSEGCCTRRKYNYCITIAQKKTKFLKEFFNVMDDMNVKYSYKNDRFTFYDKILHNYLLKLGYQHERYIPREFLDLDKNQLNILYTYLMMGDGSVRRKTKTKCAEETYYTVSEKLCHNIIEILIKMGFHASYSLRDRGNFKHRPCFCIYKKVSKQLHIFPKKHINIINYNGKIYCCSVLNKILLVNRNNKISWVGNCWGDIKQLTYKSKELISRNLLNTIQKPVKLIERLIKASSNVNDIILVPFIGSGTECLVSKSLNRNFIGFENNKECFDIAYQRIG